MRLEWEGVVKRKRKTVGKLIAGEVEAKTQEHSMSTYKAQPRAEAQTRADRSWTQPEEVAPRDP